MWYQQKTTFLEIFDRQKLSIAAAGAVFIFVSTVAMAPAQAVLLQFSFTTESGGRGTFTLDTDTAPDSNPAIVRDDDESVIVTGISYPNAISNFSFSAPYTEFRNLSAAYGVFPSLIIDSTSSDTSLSGVYYPSSCLSATGSYCSKILEPIVYSGNALELPELSANPLSYNYVSLSEATEIGVLRFDASTGDLLSADPITNFQAVPESDSVVAILALGIGGAGLLLKRHRKIFHLC